MVKWICSGSAVVVIRLYVTGQSLHEDTPSASELHSWFGLNFNLMHVLSGHIKWVRLSVCVVYYYY